MLEFTPRTTSGMQGRSGSANRQPRRLMLALGLLLLALVVLLIKDRTFWFGSEQAAIDSDDSEYAVPAQNQAAPRAAAPHASPKTTAKKQPHAPTVAVEAQPAETPGVAVTRTVLPPMDVEVVAGEKHRRLRPGSNVQHVEIPNTPSALAPTTSAAEREPLPSAAAPTPQANYSATYPLLAQHMNVQGSVILQALISAEGIVENLQVLSGPAILSTAAQQAVREWRFKPVLQNGQAVETKAKITVNFSIKVADNSADTTLAETRASDVLIISR